MKREWYLCQITSYDKEVRVRCRGYGNSEERRGGGRGKSKGKEERIGIKIEEK